MSRQLKTITEQDVARSSTSPPTNTNFTAKVVTIHDGDTCDLVFIRNRNFERFKCRLSGIDTPELEKGTPALKSRDFLAWLCLGGDPNRFSMRSQPWSETQLQNHLNSNQELVYAEFHDLGGYRRPLVTLKRQQGASKSFNQLLVDYGYASVYKKK